MGELSLGHGFYKSIAPVASNQECVNFRPNYVQTLSGVTQVILLPTEGLHSRIGRERGRCPWARARPASTPS